MIEAGNKLAIVSLVERKSEYAVLAKFTNKTSYLVIHAIINRLRPLVTRVRIITYDNGKEFTDHRFVGQEIGSTIYFADPFSSWQSDSNENPNGFLHQCIPKKRPLSTFSEEELRII